MSDFNPTHSQADIDYLLSPAAIRQRAKQLFDFALDGKTHFEIHLDKLDEVADFVKEVTLEAYPTLDLPLHSRWGHFQAGGIDRLAILKSKLEALPNHERARAKLDLVITSVLLDAGAGPDWAYRETDGDGNTISIGRSEGLAVASFYLFIEGAFSSDPNNPFQADAEGLKSLSLERLAQGFQVSDSNPLVGVEGRLQLLRSLGEAIELKPDYFGESCPRPGGLWDYLSQNSTLKSLDATVLLDAVLRGLGPIWPGRISLSGVPLGDVWMHSLLGDSNSIECLVPFHKLSQWLSYSMIEPIEEAGCSVTNVNGLTGLAEYRNGGLLIDKGFLTLRDPSLLDQRHSPKSELIIEWRALTLYSLELIAPKVRALLEKDENEFPLAKVLEGGTWRAGRKIAKELRDDGTPPIQLQSDGTVF